MKLVGLAMEGGDVLIERSAGGLLRAAEGKGVGGMRGGGSMKLVGLAMEGGDVLIERSAAGLLRAAEGKGLGPGICEGGSMDLFGLAMLVMDCGDILIGR